ncbi:flagellar assembly protein FliX [Falsiroseomonas sp.]|uniref:flagellar assembly protein FliX n=1 Tax=Falsiroseomonas sp. TaxID=2870721 RepID=UPI00271B9D39|nr:flagellar assembly protein FliX [Falsiroseomonas sp.]MDO9500777.1 flagellar assembly protein FliX [Falsiroseomonas sp.]
MAVGPVRPVGFSGVQAARPRRSAGGFALPDAGGDATATAGVAAPPAMGGLLALQESGAPERPEAVADRARRRASQALDELRGLQLDLLREDPRDAGRLARLEALAAAPEAGLAPELGALLAEVRLRARLELARRTVAVRSSN